MFLVSAANFLYFFVDDEGIPFVYAQHLLDGHGLVYSTAADGRVEGYSDFLHVWVTTGLLAFVRILGWPKIAVFFVAKACSLLAGAGIIVAVFATLRQARVPTAGALAGLGFLSLAGPLALWACSTLETVPFAFLLSVATFGLVGCLTAPETKRFEAIAAVGSSLAVLERIDGPVYIGTLLGAFLLFAGGARRWTLLTRVVLPVVATTVAYHAWRMWYYQTPLPLPIYAKVLFKLQPHGNLVTKLPARSYGLRFAELYGTAAIVIAGCAAVYGAIRIPLVRPLLVAVALLSAYVGLVGDWMWGFRFFTAVIPIAALVIALSVGAWARDHRRISWVMATAVVIWCGICARAFHAEYERSQAPGWLTVRSFDQALFFGAYDEMLDEARRHIAPGSLVAYNQAGLVPFMLYLQNIDNLGLCNAFYARLPTTDVYFTEVGPYTPFSESPSIGVRDAYLLYRDVPFIIAGANGGQAPAELMGGYYRRIATSRGEGLYARTARSTDAFRTDPTLFVENLAHVSSVTRASINGRILDDGAIQSALPFLKREYGWVDLERGAFTLDVVFGDVDELVYGIDLNGVVSDSPVTIEIDLVSRTGSRYTTRLTSPGGPNPARFFQRINGAGANGMRLTITGADPQVWLRDLRVQGQSRTLAKYVRQMLVFRPEPSQPNLSRR